MLEAALRAADPRAAIHHHLHFEGDRLRVANRLYELSEVGQVHVVGAGKASGAMAQAIEEILDERIAAGWVNVRYGYSASTRRIAIREAGHPLPDQSGLEGTRRMLELVRRAGEGELVICLISGGGSALLELPQPGISLEDLQATTDALLRCGAPIQEINAVRKHLSQVKGGRLARLAHPAGVISLILSDVVGDPLDVIASGPTVPDPTTYADAWRVIEKYGLQIVLPGSILDHLGAGRGGSVEETPKPGDPIFERVHNVIVGNNRQAALGALEAAHQLGFNPLLLTTYLEGEAREAGRWVAGLAKALARDEGPIARPACLILGGETTVTLRGSGVGGRNQELALAAAIALEGYPDVLVVACSTDGTDGPTDAAGAMVDGETVARARQLGLDPEGYLANNDTYHFFKALDDLIVTGPTRTNVNDLVLILAT
ncbi:MAG: glycerate kinase [Chloroflexi bacterium]|nr:glycerate kinase [Chloroflexota bacterium]